jgi:hypothetical protein
MMRRTTAWAVCAGLVLALGCESPWIRGGTEARRISSDAFNVSVQKNGRLDVVMNDGTRFFNDAYPMVWLAGEDSPRPIRLDYRRTSRVDRFAHGDAYQGMVLVADEAVWTVAVEPNEAIITAMLTYANTTDETQYIRAMFPWCVGDPDWAAEAGGPPSAATAGPVRLRQPTGHVFLARFARDSRETARIVRGDAIPGSAEGDLLWAMDPFAPELEVPPGEAVQSAVIELHLERR